MPLVPNAALGTNGIEAYLKLPLENKNPVYTQVINICSAKKCIALCAWGEYMLLRDQQFRAADFDQQTLDRFLQIVVWLGKVDKKMEQHRSDAIVPTLKNSSEWLKFEHQVHSQLSTIAVPF
jgi:hypothetical protein